jgi:hypothetical protein
MTTILLCSQAYARLNRMYAYAYIASFMQGRFGSSHTPCLFFFFFLVFFFWYKDSPLTLFFNSSTPMIVDHYRTRNIIVNVYTCVLCSRTYKGKWTINIKIDR